MSYRIEPSDDGNYIILTVKGNYHRKLAMQYNVEAHSLGQQLGINSYLLDMTAARNIDSESSKYVFAYGDMKRTPEIDRSARVAVLVHPDDHSHDDIVKVTRNSGLDVTKFIDRQKAIDFLLKND